MRLSIDVASQVSPELSAMMETLLRDPEIEEPITLGFVRRRLAASLPGEAEELERLHPETEQGRLLGELDALIERFTEDAPAMDFVAAKAGEPLSRAIEAVMNDPNTTRRPTLAKVREAVLGGLAARLAGEGVIEEDEEEGLLPELDSLIGRFGEDAIAEHFIRYE